MFDSFLAGRSITVAVAVFNIPGFDIFLRVLYDLCKCRDINLKLSFFTAICVDTSKEKLKKLMVFQMTVN